MSNRQFYDILLIILYTLIFTKLPCQVSSQFETPISIDLNSSSPSSNALLDIKSTSKGILIPRMSTTQRSSILSPDEGLLVYDLSTTSFWYVKNGGWTEIDNANNSSPSASNGNLINDIDNDTKVSVETHSDDDQIRFIIKGSEKLKIAENPNGIFRLDVIGNSSNHIIGDYAGNALTTGSYNCLFGTNSGLQVTSGEHNTFYGYRTGSFGTTQSHNTFIGSHVGTKITDASAGFNTFLGSGAGSHIYLGRDNVMLGYSAGYGVFESFGSILIGSSAGGINRTGNYNTIVGYYAGHSAVGSNNVFLGSNAGYFEAGSNKLVIENTNSSTPLVYGDFSADRVGINWNSSVSIPNTLSVNGNASKATSGDWLANSDARLKKNIQQIESSVALEYLLKMQGVTYEWNDDITGYDRPNGIQYGFIAQDIEKIWPQNVSKDSKGFLETPYGTYDFLYVESIKALNDKNKKLESKLNHQEKEIDKLKKITEALMSLYESSHENLVAKDN